MKKNFLKAAIPLIMMGSPALAASSVRSGSRWKVKKAVVQSDEVSTLKEENAPLFDNPFGGFSKPYSSIKTYQKESFSVLSFLAEEGLLHSSTKTNSIISGNESRKEFLAYSRIQCVPNATFGRGNLVSVFSYSYSSSTSFFLKFSNDTSLINNGTTTTTLSVSRPHFERAKIACLTNSLPTVSLTATDATESGTTGVFTVSRTGSTRIALDVILDIAGTATNGSDYNAIADPLTVTIPVGSRSTTVNIVPIDDSFVEGSETVTASITASPTNYTVLGGGNVAARAAARTDNPAANAVVVIADNDVAANNNTPENIPTLSQWAQYLLMLLLALIGSKMHLLRKLKIK